MLDKIRGSWKAIVALLIPIAFGAASEMFDVLGDWAAENGGVWAGVASGVLTSVAVWLKANRPT
jgi:hypothetical protein